MKKRNKIITFISSIFSCIALCGAFAIGLIFDHKQKASETKADTTVLLSQGAINFNYSESDFNISVVGSWRYLELYNGSVQKYQYEYRMRIYGSGVYNSQNINFYVANSDASLVSEEFICYSLLKDSISYHHSFSFEAIDYDYYEEEDTLYRFVFNSNSDNVFASKYLLPHPNAYQMIEDYIIDPQDLQYQLVDEDIVLDPVNNYDIGYADGYTSGYSQGEQNGNQTGYNNGYEQGYEQGKQDQSSVDETLIGQAYSQGYSEGYSQGESQDSTVSSIFGGMSTVALIPIRFFLSIFNFEILGINIASVVSALLSICLIIVVWRVVMGGKSND